MASHRNAPFPVLSRVFIARGRTNESRKDKETVNLVSKNDSSADLLVTKKKGHMGMDQRTWVLQGKSCNELFSPKTGWYEDFAY